MRARYACARGTRAREVRVRAWVRVRAQLLLLSFSERKIQLEADEKKKTKTNPYDNMYSLVSGRGISAAIQKFSKAPQAEEWSLKIFLEASFSKNFGSSKTLKNSPGQILQNFAPKTGPSRQIDGPLHNVALDFRFVQRFRK